MHVINSRRGFSKGTVIAHRRFFLLHREIRQRALNFQIGRGKKKMYAQMYTQMYRLNYFKHAYNGDCKNFTMARRSTFFSKNLGTFMPTAKLHILVKTFPKYYFLTFLTNDFKNLNYIKSKRHFSKKVSKFFEIFFEILAIVFQHSNKHSPASQVKVGPILVGSALFYCRKY